jgi:hypothetical protein
MPFRNAFSNLASSFAPVSSTMRATIHSTWTVGIPLAFLREEIAGQRLLRGKSDR